MNLSYSIISYEHHQLQDKAGIRTSAAATASSFTGGYQNDDTESFGAYRECPGWRTGEAPADDAKTMVKTR